MQMFWELFSPYILILEQNLNLPIFTTRTHFFSYFHESRFSKMVDYTNFIFVSFKSWVSLVYFTSYHQNFRIYNFFTMHINCYDFSKNDMITFFPSIWKHESKVSLVFYFGLKSKMLKSTTIFFLHWNHNFGARHVKNFKCNDSAIPIS